MISRSLLLVATPTNRSHPIRMRIQQHAVQHLQLSDTLHTLYIHTSAPHTCSTHCTHLLADASHTQAPRKVPGVQGVRNAHTTPCSRKDTTFWHPIYSTHLFHTPTAHTTHTCSRMPRTHRRCARCQAASSLPSAGASAAARRHSSSAARASCASPTSRAACCHSRSIVAHLCDVTLRDVTRLTRLRCVTWLDSLSRVTQLTRLADICDMVTHVWHDSLTHVVCFVI